MPERYPQQLEKDLFLQGAVAIQDDLVHNVFLSIKRFQAAGIRFWILTGDKADTAEAIGVVDSPSINAQRAAGVVDPSTPMLRLTKAFFVISSAMESLLDGEPRRRLARGESSPRAHGMGRARRRCLHLGG